jgi:hypothetical protein
VTDLSLALITGGFTIAAVAVTFGGNYLLDRARDRRADRKSRDSALADLLTTSVELVLAVNVIRAAYQYRTNNRARLMIAAAVLQDVPNLDSWKDLTDRDVQRTILRTTVGLARDRDAETRTTAADYAGMVTPQTSRFFAAARLPDGLDLMARWAPIAQAGVLTALAGDLFQPATDRSGHPLTPIGGLVEAVVRRAIDVS